MDVMLSLDMFWKEWILYIKLKTLKKDQVIDQKKMSLLSIVVKFQLRKVKNLIEPNYSFSSLHYLNFFKHNKKEEFLFFESYHLCKNTCQSGFNVILHYFHRSILRI